MTLCNWCGLRKDPPIFCNEECQEEFHKAAEKYLKMMPFLTGHRNLNCDNNEMD